MAKTTRFFFRILLTCSMICALSLDAHARGNARGSGGNPKYAAIIMDAQTGRVLHQQNPDRQLYPASLTKMMTLFLTFEAIESGRIHMNKNLVITANAMRQPPSKLGLRSKDRVTINQAILALVTRSANDVAVAVAETVGGSERHFVDMMNARAKSLGMKNTHFANPNGLPNPYQKTSVRDMAILSRALMQYFPQHYHFFSTKQFSYHGQIISSHNNLMKRFPGMDGIKTGYTNASGFNLATSAVRNNRRLIVVVFGGRTAVSRDNHVADLVNRGFAMLDRSQQSIQVASAPAAAPVTSVAPVATTPAGDTLAVATTTTQTVQVEDVIAQAAKPVTPAPVAPVQTMTVASANNVATDASTSDRGGWSPDGGSIKPLMAPETVQAGYQPVSYQPTTASVAPEGNWGIQVGAFTNAAQGQQALDIAQSQLKAIADRARAVLIPVPTAQGTIYRARLIGLSAAAAAKACQQLSECMAFAVR